MPVCERTTCEPWRCSIVQWKEKKELLGLRSSHFNHLKTSLQETFKRPGEHVSSKQGLLCAMFLGWWTLENQPNCFHSNVSRNQVFFVMRFYCTTAVMIQHMFKGQLQWIFRPLENPIFVQSATSKKQWFWNGNWESVAITVRLRYGCSGQQLGSKPVWTQQSWTGSPAVWLADGWGSWLTETALLLHGCLHNLLARAMSMEQF